eukprot:scaffold34915_cov180-Amphora_coffeaeformis.AAC.6
MKERKIICVTSSKPSTVLTAGGGGGCLTLVCPRTTSVFSSLRVSGDMSGKVGVGLSSLSFFPKSFSSSSPNSLLAMGYGYTAKNKEDSYAMLITIRQASVPPILHWKTRLPEGHLTAGITVSPCGHYAIGGGNSGNLYIWSTFGGNLLRVVKAHYRPVQHMTWIKTLLLATGGADGMVHVFDLSDLVESTVDASPSPVRTWSQHHLPITGLVALSDHRLASASSDGKVLLLHVPSQKVMVTMQMPNKVSALMTDRNNTLFVGSTHGVISCIRLDEFAMHQLSQNQGMSLQRSLPQAKNMRAVDQVFGANSTETSPSDTQGIQYRTELKGHDRPISFLTILENDDTGKPSLCSGDESGCVRIWDLESKTCLQVTKPWSASMSSTDTKASAHPVSGIFILSQSDEVSTMSGMLVQAGTGTASSTTSKQQHKQQQATSLVPLLTPLQKFRDTESNGKVLLPVWKPSVSSRMPNVEASHDMLLARHRNRRKQQFSGNKRPKLSVEDYDEAMPQQKQDDERVAELERQLYEAHQKIERWEAVNNQLLSQLKKP